MDLRDPVDVSRPRGSLELSTLVSFWGDDGSNVAAKFLCSGVFVGDGLVLTVRHMLPIDESERLTGSVWARPYVGGQSALRVRSRPVLHRTLDAALLRLARMPQGATFASLDLDPIDSTTAALTLNGFFEGNLEHGIATGWTTFNDSLSIHLFEPRQPKGHSGSPLARGGRVWGIASSHYRDPNIGRGCAIAASQLWSGFLADHVMPSSPLPLPVTSRTNIAERESEIHGHIGRLNFEAAYVDLHDLATDGGNREEIGRATVISVKVLTLKSVKLSGAAMIKQSAELAKDMVQLLNDIIERLALEVGR